MRLLGRIWGILGTLGQALSKTLARLHFSGLGVAVATSSSPSPPHAATTRQAAISAATPRKHRYGNLTAHLPETRLRRPHPTRRRDGWQGKKLLPSPRQAMRRPGAPLVLGHAVFVNDVVELVDPDGVLWVRGVEILSL
jgi:hypothetical protein